MTDPTQATQAQSTQATAPEAKKESAPTQQVDVAAIEAKVREAAKKEAQAEAKKMAAEHIKEIGRAFSGESQPSGDEIAKRALETNTLSTLEKVVSAAKEQAKKEIRDELNQQREVSDTQARVIGPMIDEYPGLKNQSALAAVDKLTEEKLRGGMSYAQALEEAGKQAVKDLGLKSVSEAVKDGTYRQVGLPTGGGFSPSAPQFNDTKSTQDFLTGLKAKSSAHKSKATSK